MRIWTVFVRDVDSVGAHVCRYIDSQWADINHASEREAELKASIKACGASRHEVFIVEMKVADAETTAASTPNSEETAGAEADSQSKAGGIR